MKPTAFPEQTIVLQRPAGMTEEQCGTLAVFTDGDHCISRWAPSWKERLLLVLGAPVWLWVWSGRTQPPVAVTVAVTVDSPFVAPGVVYTIPRS